jgi:hypothetical protein
MDIQVDWIYVHGKSSEQQVGGRGEVLLSNYSETLGDVRRRLEGPCTDTALAQKKRLVVFMKGQKAARVQFEMEGLPTLQVTPTAKEKRKTPRDLLRRLLGDKVEFLSICTVPRSRTSDFLSLPRGSLRAARPAARHWTPYSKSICELRPARR